MECTDLNIFGAIHHWFLGQKLDAFCIYGAKTVWLGRIAKLIAFIAAFTFIIDIFGEKRILKASQELRRIMSIPWRRSIYLIKLLLHNKISPLGLAFIVTVVLIVSSLAWVYYAAPHMRFVSTSECLIRRYSNIPCYDIDFIPAIRSFLFSVMLLFAAALIPYFIAYIIEVISRVFAYPKLCVAIRIISAMMILIAFIIDILVS